MRSFRDLAAALKKWIDGLFNDPLPIVDPKIEAFSEALRDVVTARARVDLLRELGQMDGLIADRAMLAQLRNDAAAACAAAEERLAALR